MCKIKHLAHCIDANKALGILAACLMIYFTYSTCSHALTKYILHLMCQCCNCCQVFLKHSKFYSKQSLIYACFEATDTYWCAASLVNSGLSFIISCASICVHVVFVICKKGNTYYLILHNNHQ